jgi:hypothetical protein
VELSPTAILLLRDIAGTAGVVPETPLILKEIFLMHSSIQDAGETPLTWHQVVFRTPPIQVIFEYLHKNEK